MPHSSIDFLKKPDYELYSQYARWEVEWLPALSLDCDPEIVTRNAVETDACPSELRERYLKRHSIIENHRMAGRFPYAPVPPEFLAWAKNSGVDCPPQLVAAVEARVGLITDWKVLFEREHGKADAAENKVAHLETRISALEADLKNKRQAELASLISASRPLYPKEQQTLLKLILGMALHKYGYKPEHSTSASSLIMASLKRYGISVNQKSVLKWLRLAAEEVEYELPT
jgi:hypothetical protein